LVEVAADVVLANDITAPISLREFDKLGVDGVFDTEKIVLVADHFAPNKDIKSAQQCLAMRQFAREKGVVNHFDVGQMGIEHVLLPEQGLVLPGDLVVGADSHTCTYGALGAFASGMGSTDIAVAMATGIVWLRVPQTMRFVYTGSLQPWVGGKDLILYTIGQIGVDGALYRAMEFKGPAIAALPMADRFTICNMAVEAGAKNGIIAPDVETEQYLLERTSHAYEALISDHDAKYAATFEFACEELQPQVASPFSPDNVSAVQDAGDVAIDAAIIGSCTNGRFEDLRIAADIIRGRHVARGVRLIVIPATQKTYLQALKEGLLEVFAEAGGAVSTPTCGPCFGGHMGLLAAGERAVSTTNRNFVGRMGHAESEVYLASPAVAAASAVVGRLVHPAEVVG